MNEKPCTHLLYLHGFRSSPLSTKSRQMAAHIAAHQPEIQWWCPQLPPSPRAAANLIDEGTRHWPSQTMAVIGSSLGGFYATWLAERRNCQAVLLNPAVHAGRDLAKYVGEHTSWHDPAEKFVFEAGFVNELKALQSSGLAEPANYFAVIAKGDEVLDWREMTARYQGKQSETIQGAKIKLLEGGDHALSDFDDHMQEILDFLRISSEPLLKRRSN